MTDDLTLTITPRWSRTRRWVTGLILWTLIALFFTSEAFFEPSVNDTSHASRHASSSWLSMLGHYLVSFYFWGILSIGIVAFTSRFGLQRERWFRSGLVYLAVGLGFSLLHFVASITFFRTFGLVRRWIQGGALNQPEIFLDVSVSHILRVLQSNLILFTGIASVCLALSYYRKFQEREIRSSKLEAQLTQAQLDALKTQLQPHFLFNTLNAISALVRDDPELAERMIIRLSDLLRATLEQIGQEQIRVGDELDFVRRYLEIEKMRFGDRLVVDLQIAPETVNALVPTLIVQTLVENAMRHGVAAVSSECQVTIVTRRSGSMLCLQVLDTGPGMRAGECTESGGLGIANSINRLRHLYGEQYEFKAGNRENVGFEVQIEIPFFVSEDHVIGEVE